MPFCTECGSKVAEQDKFCRSCGAKLSPVIKVRSCSQCGTILEPTARFCPNCGAKVEEAVAKQVIPPPPLPLDEVLISNFRKAFQELRWYPEKEELLRPLLRVGEQLIAGAKLSAVEVEFAGEKAVFGGKWVAFTNKRIVVLSSKGEYAGEIPYEDITEVDMKSSGWPKIFKIIIWTRLMPKALRCPHLDLSLGLASDTRNHLLTTTLHNFLRKACGVE